MKQVSCTIDEFLEILDNHTTVGRNKREYLDWKSLQELRLELERKKYLEIEQRQ